MSLSLRVVLMALGVVFGIIWAAISSGWATVVVCAFAGYYVGAVSEGCAALSVFSALLDPLRRSRWADGEER